MNDTFKTSIRTRLERAINAEELTTSDVSRILGVQPNYISMIKNPNHWSKCPVKAWEAVSAWVNSGQKLREYEQKHGKLLPDNMNLKGISEALTGAAGPQNTSLTAPIPIVQMPHYKEHAVNAPFKFKDKQSDCSQKLTIDIEINLIINGKKITL